MDNLKQLTIHLKIADRVTFAGWLPAEEELNDALASTYIGLVMRNWTKEIDHFHMTDILAVNLKGIAEVIEEGQNGFLFPEHDKDAFKIRLQLLAQSPVDRICYGRESLSSSKKISSIEYIAEDICSLLQQLPLLSGKEIL